MNFYEQMAATAVRLLTQFGTDATLQTGGVTVSDKVAGTVTKTNVESKTVKAVVTDFTKSLIDGTTVCKGDKNVVMAPTEKPAIGDTITINGYTWSILDINESNPAGTVLVYFLHVRK
ncbi:virion structrual protein [Acinetobacter phage SH-Ab 15497]|nr:virion structrual protein [Acinetobacter phage SH-Ab 15497]